MQVIPKPIKKRTKQVVKKIKKKKEKIKSLSWYKSEADRLFSLFIRARDNNVCITCLSTSQPQNGHFHSRDIIPLRYCEKNNHCQCMVCNVLKKGNYPIYTIRMLDKYGADWLYEMDEIASKYKRDRMNGQTKYGKEFYQSIIKLYGNS